MALTRVDVICQGGYPGSTSFSLSRRKVAQRAHLEYQVGFGGYGRVAVEVYP